jgi:hypothetical protein
MLIVFHRYIIASTAFTGTLAYTFATVLQEPVTTIIPAFAAFSVYVCKVALQKQLTWSRDFEDRNGFHDAGPIRVPVGDV